MRLKVKEENMPGNKPRALIDVAETGKGFVMEDCEFQLNGRDRPILETKAENTRVIRLKVMTALSKIKERKWLWGFVMPLTIALLVKGIGILFF